MKLRDLFALLRETATQWSSSQVVRLAAAISYYAASSILSLLALTGMLSSLFLFSEQAIRSEIVHGIEQIIGEENAQVIDGALADASNDLRQSSPFAALGIVAVLLYSTSRLFRRLRDALNVIWDVEHLHPPQSMVRQYVKDTVISLAAAVIFGLLLLVILLLNGVAFIAVDLLDRLLPETTMLQIWQFVGYASLLLIMIVVFTLIYRFMPDTRLPWRSVLIGGTVTATLFTLGQFVIGWYIDLTNTGTVFGVLGAFLVILLWVYICAYIVLFGAIFTYLYDQRQATPHTPTITAQSG